MTGEIKKLYHRISEPYPVLPQAWMHATEELSIFETTTNRDV